MSISSGLIVLSFKKRNKVMIHKIFKNSLNADDKKKGWF